MAAAKSVTILWNPLTGVPKWQVISRTAAAAGGFGWKCHTIRPLFRCQCWQQLCPLHMAAVEGHFEQHQVCAPEGDSPVAALHAHHLALAAVDDMYNNYQLFWPLLPIVSKLQAGHT
jgi:hypothetical protein